MLRARLCTAVGCLATLLPAAASSSDDAAPGAILKGKGLRRQGSTYVLAGEAEFSRKVAEARALYRGYAEALRQEEALARQPEADQATIRELKQQRVFLYQQVAQVKTAQENNRLVGMINQISLRIDLLSSAPRDSRASKEIHAQASSRRGAYIQAVLDLRALADASAKAYAEFADDAEVKRALAALSVPNKPRVTLGPSRAYLADLESLAKAEGAILTQTIPLRTENGLSWIDVTLNEKVTMPLLFDTGANTVSLGAEDAAKAGLVPRASDPTVQVRIGGGSHYEAKQMTLDSVRVGKFVVRNVECVVAPKEKTNMTPLLGGAFLNHFSFQLDQAAGTVTFTEIEAPGDATPKEARKGNPPHLRNVPGGPGRRPLRPPGKSRPRERRNEG